MAIKIWLLAVACLALAGVSQAAGPKCGRGANKSPTVRERSTGGHAYGQALPLGIQVFQPWKVVSEPPGPQLAHSVLFGK